MRLIIRSLGDFPITLFGALSLAAYVIAAFTASPPGSVLRALMLPAYVIQLVIAVVFGGILRPLGNPVYWILTIPLYFAPFVLLDLALARASHGRYDAQGRGAL